MRQAARTAVRTLREFALGIHLANGIRHGVPQSAEASGRRAWPDQTGRSAADPGESIGPVFDRPFAGPAVASSSRV